MSANPIFVIQPYRYAGTWVYDDEKRGFKAEPFIEGIPDIIDEAVKQIPMADGGFRLLFSAKLFPRYTFKLEWVREESEGNWYRTEDGREGWLGSALLTFFPVPPKEIYAKAEPLVKVT
jgi:hypothetical protein